VSEKPTNFIRTKIADQIKQGQISEIVTRFPPEPNGYLHVGHAKSICLNFGLAEEFGGRCNLRFDDTNPEKESQEYIDAIGNDVRWLGFEWSNLCHTADYFEQLFDWALHLIRNGDAYVDEQSAEAMRLNRGTLTEPGIDSPYRDRSPAENEALFCKMRDGELPEGAAVLRAKISMSAPNVNLRDPALYRIRHIAHPRAGDQWCIYPTYDYAHGQSDAIEGITHSLCTLEFEDHRPLYEWLLKKLPVPSRPKQTEFSRLELEGTVTSKRKLNALVQAGHVSGWDDPRMPTIAGMRRRGYSPEGIRLFCERIGVTRKPNTIELQILEGSVRDDLEGRAHKAMAVAQDDPHCRHKAPVLQKLQYDLVVCLQAHHHIDRSLNNGFARVLRLRGVIKLFASEQHAGKAQRIRRHMKLQKLHGMSLLAHREQHFERLDENVFFNCVVL